jgi:hypothetical protein
VIDADADLTAQHVKYAGSCTIKIQYSLHPTWNGQPNPFTDKKVREAFALAFDAESGRVMWMAPSPCPPGHGFLPAILDTTPTPRCTSIRKPPKPLLPPPLNPSTLLKS